MESKFQISDTMILCKIIPKSPFHIGEKGVGLEETETIIHSDTLFSAICNSYRLLYGKKDLEDFIKDAKTNLKISSAFLEVNGIKTFPLPMNINWGRYVYKNGKVNEELFKKINKESDLLKKLKKVKFVSEEIFGDIQKYIDNIENHINDIHIKQGILFSEKEFNKINNDFKDIKFYKETETPRVTLDRKTSSSNIYYFGEVKFAEKCNLFFLIGYNGNLDKIKSAVRLLGDEGIGGDRSSGRGLFKVEFANNDFSFSNNGNKYVSLSLVYPKKEEVKNAKFYDLIARRGFVYSIEERSARRKSIRMFAEGSVFSNKVEGEIKDVSINSSKHEVYRFGKAFLIGIGDKNE